jgi:ribonuclease III family protein
MEEFFDSIEYNVSDVREYSPVTLAYIGDSVYELYIRSYLLKDENLTSYSLHKRAVKYVSAKSQAVILARICAILDEDEKNIVRRAKNQKTLSLPKNALLEDYKQATAFEALIGYLYLKKDYERLDLILGLTVREEETE